MKKYLSSIEAAERLGISISAVDDLCAKGELEEAYQRYENSPWRIPINSVEKYLGRQGERTPSTQKENSAEAKPPNVWAWVWNKVPARFRTAALLVVALLLGATFLTNLANSTQGLFRSEPDPTPTLVANVTDQNLGVTHIVRERLAENYGCIHDVLSLPSKEISNINSVADNERYNTVLELSKTIAPAALSFSFFQEKRTEFDEAIITNLNLAIDNYTPINEPEIIVLSSFTCAEPYIPSKLLASILVDPNQKNYNVLAPRFTSQNTEGIFVEHIYEPFRIDINSLQPGEYSFSLTADFLLNGQQRHAGPLKYNVIVPDLTKIQSVYTLDSFFMEGFFGPEDHLPFLDAYSTAQNKYLVTDFFLAGATLEGLQGQYTYIVNLGNDIEMTGWTLWANRELNVGGDKYFEFPNFILKSGSGVRIWGLEGENSESDLFGAIKVFPDLEKPGFSVDLLDSSGGFVATYYRANDQ